MEKCVSTKTDKKTKLEGSRRAEKELIREKKEGTVWQKIKRKKDEHLSAWDKNIKWWAFLREKEGRIYV